MPTGNASSRRDQQGDADDQAPYLGESAYLVQYLAEIGNARYESEVVSPITWGEIDAWSRVTKTIITAEEAFALRRLSSAIAHQSMISRDPLCQKPGEDQQSMRDRVASKIMSIFRMIKGPASD